MTVPAPPQLFRLAFEVTACHLALMVIPYRDANELAARIRRIRRDLAPLAARSPIIASAVHLIDGAGGGGDDETLDLERVVRRLAGLRAVIPSIAVRDQLE